ncbi:MAG: OmpA family protein [Deltaproteobacteria bacterium]|nr:OmpA family protein [Deltaproteobacteria bacterium]
MVSHWRRFILTTTLGFITVIMMAWIPPSLAQEGGNVRLQPQRLAMDSQGLLTLDASQVLPHGDPSFGLVLSYARQPLVLQSATARYQVDHALRGQFQGAFGLWGHLEMGLSVPLAMWKGTAQPGALPAEDESEVTAQGVGDLQLHLKWRLLDTSRSTFGLAVLTSFSLPTGDGEAFLGEGAFAIAPRLVLDMRAWRRRVHGVLNVGAHLYPSGSPRWQQTRLCDGVPCGTGRLMDGGHSVTWGAGLSVAVIPNRVALFSEVFGQLGTRGFLDFSRLHSAHEAVVGCKLYLASRSYLVLAVGRGLHASAANHQVGSPALSTYLGFIFEPAMGDGDGDGLADDVDACPTQAEDMDDFEDEDGCPDDDNDRDKILDADDRCPNEAEDFDGDRDGDGCPEGGGGDRDGDGIPDEHDKCPDDPEDKDGFEDADGCPDLDNDKDGILDTDDLCPNRPEDKDRFEDNDGCPDPDNDNDGILDGDDRCPLVPETVNGYQDEDGCPDKVVMFGKGKLLVLQRIFFETNLAVIKKQSYPTLDAVARSLKDNEWIRLLEVQGHADERGSKAHNLRLTWARAKAVYTYLCGRGVKAKRLRWRGYGESRPRERGHTPEAWSVNRRVEFVIIKGR